MRTRRAVIARFLAVLAPTVLLASALAPTASAGPYPCRPGEPGQVELRDSEPEGRPYIPAFLGLPPSQLKYFAMTTANADGSTGPCECVRPRPWGEGLAPEAVASLIAAMDAKEAQAIANHALFGIPAEQVPVQKRTIWIRAAWRSNDEQTCIWNTLGPGWAARPGRSKHQSGISIDIEDWGPRFIGEDDRLLYAHGWCRTVPAEPWHYEYKPLLDAQGQGSRCK
ncbi:MAG: hypothetical protein GY812_04365 [Actinomycetia bacterium]|nr:hypothetical protein [Actinomycetes bacterium]